MPELTRIDALKHDVRENILSTLLSEAKVLFDIHPDLTSFSWAQFTTRGGDNSAKKFSVYHTLNTPNVNGNISAKIVDIPIANLQIEITKTMSKFDVEMLFLGFGDDCEVSIYRDLTYEVNNIL